MKLHGDRKSAMIKASIVITAYNVESYIEKCIMSVINQTEKNIEIIIVNDGSTDCTLSKINKLANYDKRIRIIDKKNEGVMKARYDGLEIAIGKYILFVDADDWIEKECIEQLYNNAECNNSDIVMYNSYIVTENDKKFISRINSNKSDDYLKSILIGRTSQYLWDKFIKREFIINNKIPFKGDLNYAEDSHAQVDSNVVLTQSGKIVDFQTTSEGEPYEFERMIELFNTAKDGIGRIIEMY